MLQLTPCSIVLSLLQQQIRAVQMVWRESVHSVQPAPLFLLSLIWPSLLFLQLDCRRLNARPFRDLENCYGLVHESWCRQWLEGKHQGWKTSMKPTRSCQDFSMPQPSTYLGRIVSLHACQTGRTARKIALLSWNWSRLNCTFWNEKEEEKNWQPFEGSHGLFPIPPSRNGRHALMCELLRKSAEEI